MPAGVSLALYVVAIILFALAASPFPGDYAGRLVPAGLAFFAAAHVVG